MIIVVITDMLEAACMLKFHQRKHMMEYDNDDDDNDDDDGDRRWMT